MRAGRWAKKRARVINQVGVGTQTIKALLPWYGGFQYGECGPHQQVFLSWEPSSSVSRLPPGRKGETDPPVPHMMTDEEYYEYTP